MLRGTGMLGNFITNIKRILYFIAYLIRNVIALNFDKFCIYCHESVINICLQVR